MAPPLTSTSITDRGRGKLVDKLSGVSVCRPNRPDTTLLEHPTQRTQRTQRNGPNGRHATNATTTAEATLLAIKLHKLRLKFQ